MMVNYNVLLQFFFVLNDYQMMMELCRAKCSVRYVPSLCVTSSDSFAKCCSG